MVDLKERIALSGEFSAEERVFLLEAINAATRPQPGSGVVDQSWRDTWKDIPADKVLEAGMKRCPTCGSIMK
jgi:hypothetical protein